MSYTNDIPAELRTDGRKSERADDRRTSQRKGGRADGQADGLTDNRTNGWAGGRRTAARAGDSQRRADARTWRRNRPPKRKKQEKMKFGKTPK